MVWHAGGALGLHDTLCCVLIDYPCIYNTDISHNNALSTVMSLIRQKSLSEPLPSKVDPEEATYGEVHIRYIFIDSKTLASL